MKVDDSLVLRNAFASPVPPSLYMWTFITAIQPIGQSEGFVLPDVRLEVLPQGGDEHDFIYLFTDVPYTWMLIKKVGSSC